MSEFTIGKKKYDVKITYRVRRFLLSKLKSDIIENMTLEDNDDVVLKAILMSLPGKEFATEEDLYDVLEDNEFKAFEAYFARMLRNPELEGKTDVEKKPEQTTTM